MQCPEYLLFWKHHHNFWDKWKTLIIFLFVFYYNDSWMIPKLLDSVYNFVISCDEIVIITMISRCFIFGIILMENLLKTSATAWSSVIIFSKTVSSWPSWEILFFSISVILDFVFALSVKNGFIVFQTVLFSVMSLVLLLLKKFFFSLLIKLTQRLRRLLYYVYVTTLAR